MKKTLLSMALCLFVGVGANAEVKLELQGGVAADYGWTTAQAMYDDITAIADEVRGGTRTWLTLAEISDSLAHYGGFSEQKDASGNPLPKWGNANTFAGGTYYSSGADVAWTAFQEKLPVKFQWLMKYLEVSAAKALDFGLFRNNVTAFFSDTKWSGWPSSADYATCGVSSEAWKPYFAFYAAPTREGYKFLGWFENAEGTGEAVTELPADGTLYAVWQANPASALENAEVEQVEVRKVIENGQLIIIKNGVRYNALGAVVK